MFIVPVACVACAPVPLSGTWVAPLAPLWEMVRVPLNVVAEPGVKVTVAVHVALAARLLGQLWVTENGLAAVMLLIWTVYIPVFRRVVDNWALLPTETDPNAKDDGVAVMSDGV